MTVLVSLMILLGGSIGNCGEFEEVVNFLSDFYMEGYTVGMYNATFGTHQKSIGDSKRTIQQTSKDRTLDRFNKLMMKVGMTDIQKNKTKSEKELDDIHELTKISEHFFVEGYLEGETDYDYIHLELAEGKTEKEASAVPVATMQQRFIQKVSSAFSKEERDRKKFVLKTIENTIMLDE
jgi:hypothetical protein